MIEGLSHLIALRKQRLRPASLMLSVDIPFKPLKFEHQHSYMELVASGSIARDDFRPFAGLPILFYVPKWNQFSADVFEKLKEHADEITLLSPEYGPDIGFVWSKQYGMLDMGIIGWLARFYEAKGRVCRTEKETQERVALESEALANLELHPSEYRREA